MKMSEINKNECKDVEAEIKINDNRIWFTAVMKFLSGNIL
jgi:hypothetical protein